MFCVDESGTLATEPGPALDELRGLERPDHPLDPIDDDSHSDAISVFLTALTEGEGPSSTPPAMPACRDVRRPRGGGLHGGDPVGTDRHGDGARRTGRATGQGYALPFDTGRVLRFDDRYRRMFGWTEEEVVGKPRMSVVHPDDQPAGLGCFAEILKSRRDRRPGAGSDQRVDGHYRWIEMTRTNHLEADEPHHVGGGRHLRADGGLRRTRGAGAVAGRHRPLDPGGAAAPRCRGRPLLWNDRWKR